MHFPEFPFIPILHDNTSVFHPRSWSDFIYVPMTHNPCLSDMSKRVHRFPLSSITASFHIKCTSALMLWCGLTQVTHIKLALFSRQQHTLVSADSYTSCSSPLFPSTLLSLFLSLSLSLSLLLIVASLNTFLVYSTLGVLFHNCC
ncbi:unnamed protein product [Hymenolepis diminuta]|uniref:Uncharacterized protein n=1 Tax=Hymenolepis diminuta TaxID=6216 RepID=A0A564Z3P2_HYMDI|nr:unnamed protein product [Hymenolepis diminuta]